MNIRSLRSIAKIAGTVICVTGAIFMALLRGPKLLNAQILPEKSFFGSEGEHWLLGCLFLIGSAFCWSLWLILQVFGSNSSLHLSDISITNIIKKFLTGYCFSQLSWPRFFNRLDVFLWNIAVSSSYIVFRARPGSMDPSFQFWACLLSLCSM